MRIVGGTYKRRIISPPKNLPVRPTTDLAKESLFNILANIINLHDKVVADLFSGTGNISYEFVSRGAEKVLSIEQNFACVKFIRQTAAGFEMNQLSVIQSDVFRFLKTGTQAYDVIFADPPYALENIPEIQSLVFEYNRLKPNGWLIIEHPKSVDFSECKYFHSLRKYGKVHFSFFQYTEKEGCSHES
jgi:16S rRNA (guanine(966)-N(2))-methyltransferase RsmD